MSIERQIAAQAREFVKARKQEESEHKEETEYRSLCESFPMLLRSAGLAQSVSYLKAKADDKSRANMYSLFYGHMEQHFRALGFLGSEALSEWAASPNLSCSQYRLYSEIAMHVAMWHKRLAQAVLRPAPKKKEQE